MNKVFLQTFILLVAFASINAKTSKGTCGWASPSTAVSGFDYSSISGSTYYVYAHDSSVKSETSCMKFDFKSNDKVIYKQDGKILKSLQMSSNLGKISCSSDGHCTIKHLGSKRYFQIVNSFKTSGKYPTLYVYSCEQKWHFWKEENFYILETDTVDTTYSQATLDGNASVLETFGYVPSDYSLSDLTAMTAC